MTNTPETPALRIQARPVRGIRRCGVRHPPQAVMHPPGRFTAEEVIILLADPDLVAEVLAPPVIQPPAPDGIADDEAAPPPDPVVEGASAATVSPDGDTPPARRRKGGGVA